MLGGIPTSSVKRVLKVPSDEQPTTEQTSVTLRSPRRKVAVRRLAPEAVNFRHRDAPYAVDPLGLALGDLRTLVGLHVALIATGYDIAAQMSDVDVDDVAVRGRPPFPPAPGSCSGRPRGTPFLSV